MTEKDIEMEEMHMLDKAIKSLEEDMEDETPDFCGELKLAAWNVLYENPGIDRGEWINILFQEYPTEVVDALGSNPEEVYSLLEDWWDCNDYEDHVTAECHSFRDWAEYFATERSVELYDLLSEAKREITRLKSQRRQKMG